MKRKWLIIIAAILIVLIPAVIISKNLYERGKLSNQICKVIDVKCDDNDANECVIDLNVIADFSWDKMLLYEVGMTSSEIGEILDVDFSDYLEWMSGMVFVKDNKVVYHESIFYDGETRVKLNIYVERVDGEGKYFVCTPANAEFIGMRWIGEDGKKYYTIKTYEKHSNN